MKYVALLRGINVGGNNMIKMETLRAAFSALGFTNVKSYINSGNLVFETGKADEKQLVKKIHGAIEKEFGFDISVMVRPTSELVDLVKNNPFEGQFENDKYMHVFFLDDELGKEKKELLFAQGSDDELFAVIGRHVLCLLRIHILDSTVGKGFIDKKLKIASTGRNWRTVKTLAEM